MPYILSEKEFIKNEMNLGVYFPPDNEILRSSPR